MSSWTVCIEHFLLKFFMLLSIPANIVSRTSRTFVFFSKFVPFCTLLDGYFGLGGYSGAY